MRLLDFQRFFYKRILYKNLSNINSIYKWRKLLVFVKSFTIYYHIFNVRLCLRISRGMHNFWLAMYSESINMSISQRISQDIILHLTHIAHWIPRFVSASRSFINTQYNILIPQLWIMLFSFQLLSSLATDLDLMLNDLRSTPPRFIQPRASSVSIVSQLG